MSHTPTIVDHHGRPARAAADRDCPRCSAAPTRRIASGGFGTPHPVCGNCGYEWLNDIWRGGPQESER